MQDSRDHIFISYATEQAVLCDWLARKLAAEGYAVWYDRLKILGGENWPTDIDEAINQRTFRMLALLSRASVNKPNPTGEWLKGRAVGNKLGVEDFVIPLNTEGLRPYEIPWNLQPINYILFSPSWAEGLASLLTKLESIETPTVLPDGRVIAVRSMAQTTAVLNQSEPLISNCFEVVQVPRLIGQYETVPDFSAKDLATIRASWPHWSISHSRFLAFCPPGSDSRWTACLKQIGTIDWSTATLIAGTATLNVVKFLIHRSLEQVLKSAGMRLNSSTRQWFFPRQDSGNPSLQFTLPNGKSSIVSSGGERTFWSSGYSQKYRYYLSPSFSLLRDQIDPFVLILRNHIYLTDVSGRPLEPQRAVSRRKHLCKDWFNGQWAARTLAIAQALAGDDMTIRFGPAGEQQLIISGTPISLEASKRLLDEEVDQPYEHLVRQDDD